MRKTLKYKGADVVYSHSGSGQPIVLLHGFLEERSMWEQLIEELTDSYEIIAIDLLGQGESGNVGYVHSMEMQADAVATVIAEERIQKCTVIGHSMGGYIALALAEKCPDLVDGLILMHSTASPDSEEKRKDRERIIGLVQRNSRVYIQAVIPTLFAESTRDRYKSEIEHLTNVALKFSRQGIIANIRGMMERKDRRLVLKNGAFRKLIIHGLADPILNHSDILMQAELDDSIQLKLMDEIGHMGHIESPKVCYTAISEFCKN